MFNLIRRDVILQKKQLLIFIPYLLVFILAGSHPILIFTVASIFIPLNTYAYDEKVQTNILLNSLPYTRKEIIASRYLGALFYMILGISITCIVLTVFNKAFTIQDLLFSIGLFLIYISIMFPLFYIVKQGYFFIIAILSFLASTFIGPPIVSFLGRHFPAITTVITEASPIVLYISCFVLLAFVFLISWRTTLGIYLKKAF
ncbi:ABC-2 transporter permease [Bacillus sp. B1-b2]|uniref:ABC-2 transporter permease n=1 Tax=Bacillus sp. B1-b2 TaxID=2653201 RepID=UPI001262A194|nr:ABC-2 transporter permease [Bacillus sp. B1-b2]KAB7672858.1 ABC-2 transporter permease [Bacillus sp. B1-b2]